MFVLAGNGIVNTGDNILTAEGVTLRYEGMDRPALSSVSLAAQPGVTLGIVGESGSGKSSLARCFLGLEKIQSGRVCYRGTNISDFDHVRRKAFRGKVQMVFQDPYNSLNPRMTVGQMLNEVLLVHRLVPPKDSASRINELLEMTGLNGSMASRYPHELSGGQRQRVGIARALSMKPEVIIADEPVSALDVSVQAHILNLLVQLVKECRITLILIAHDLAVVRHVCHRIAVMKKGTIVEEGQVSDVIERPQHAYTQSLLAAVPDIESIIQLTPNVP